MCDDFEDDDEECEHDGVEVSDQMTICHLCQITLQPNDTLHPVMMKLDATRSVVVFFHDACHRKSSNTAIKTACAAVKWNVMLMSYADNEIAEC